MRAWPARGYSIPGCVSQRGGGQILVFQCRTLSDLDRGQTQNWQKPPTSVKISMSDFWAVSFAQVFEVAYPRSSELVSKMSQAQHSLSEWLCQSMLRLSTGSYMLSLGRPHPCIPWVSCWTNEIHRQLELTVPDQHALMHLPGPCRTVPGQSALSCQVVKPHTGTCLTHPTTCMWQQTLVTLPSFAKKVYRPSYFSCQSKPCLGLL